MFRRRMAPVFCLAELDVFDFLAIFACGRDAEVILKLSKEQKKREKKKPECAGVICLKDRLICDIAIKLLSDHNSQSIQDTSTNTSIIVLEFSYSIEM